MFVGHQHGERFGKGVLVEGQFPGLVEHQQRVRRHGGTVRQRHGDRDDSLFHRVVFFFFAGGQNASDQQQENSVPDPYGREA